MIKRSLEKTILHHVQRGKSILLLGPRQVGKTTLLKKIKCDRYISLLSPGKRREYEKNPDQLKGEILALNLNIPLIIIDEIQKVPILTDVIQELIDDKIAQFILTGSSARKLKKSKSVNLLPGRVISLRLDPLSSEEYSLESIEDILFYGHLPGIILNNSKKDQELELKSYVDTYLEEEVRAEALVRDLGPFARFLELAGLEAGRIMSYSSVSQEIGVDSKTIRNYFEILFDCLVAERIDPITKSETRKKLVKSSRYLFFDMGVRRLSSDEGTRVTPERKGELFEQFIGIELIRILRHHFPTAKLKFWKDSDGPEIDWVVEIDKVFIPIEVKWKKTVSKKDAKHLNTFLTEYSNTHTALIVSRNEEKIQLDQNIKVIPWQKLPETIIALCKKVKRTS